MLLVGCNGSIKERIEAFIELRLVAGVIGHVDDVPTNCVDSISSSSLTAATMTSLLFSSSVPSWS
jgi:hypothetical protein